MIPTIVLALLFVVLCAALLATVLILLIKPLLRRYALARPIARSSHRVPTPQGAGVAVIASTLIVAGTAMLSAPMPDLTELGFVFAATLLIALVGAIDDLRPIPVLPRLALQALAVGLVVFAMRSDAGVFPFLPLWLERALILLTGLWFVNLVNFMDGIDWITAAEVVPVTAALMLLGVLNQLPLPAVLVAATLCGAMIGFAPFNRPVAKIFLGDVGSLPIGLLLGWCLLELMTRGHIVAAVLLPLYYLCDATLTLARRFAKGETVWIAHRSHFYQRATDNGFMVLRVVGTVFVLNILLASLALLSALEPSRLAGALTLAAGFAAVAFVLMRFSKNGSVSPAD